MAEEENGADGGQSKSKLLIIIIIVLLVLLIGGGVAAFMMISGQDNNQSAANSEPVQLPAIYFDLKPPFVVNFQQGGRQRYVQMTLSVLARQESALSALTTHMPQVRNNLVLLLSTQDFEMLRTPEGKEELRTQVLDEMRKILLEETGDPGIEQVLFTNFVMQ